MNPKRTDSSKSVASDGSVRDKKSAIGVIALARFPILGSLIRPGA